MDDTSADVQPDPTSSAGTPPPDTSTLAPTSAAVPDTNPASATSTQPQSHVDPSLDADAEIDASIEQEVNVSMDGSGASDTAPSASQPPIPGTAAAAADQQPNGLLKDIPSIQEPRIPVKKDTSLREFMGKMDEYAPLIPDAVTDYYLTLAGLPPPPETDRRLARLLALATQKFIADIASDAYQYSRIRSTNTTSNNPLTGLGGAAGFGLPGSGGAGDDGGGGGGGAGKGGKKDAGVGKLAPLGGPRAGYGGGGASGAQGRTVLTMEDLGMAVGEYGVNVKRGEFYR